MPLTYKSAGVDLEVYDQAMQKIPALLGRTFGPHQGRVLPLPGGFAGLFRLAQEGKKFRDPVLVSGTDGVGTKIKIAIQAQRYDTIGIDLVAMCVNDCLCLGAEPLFFLDYIAMPKDDPELLGQLVLGVSEGCLQAKSALLGGETAIMPGLYASGDFDMAGFSVGVVEKDQIVDGKAIVPGDVVLGLPSAGLHSNGFSLVRKIVIESAGLGIDDVVPEFGQTVGDVLLVPTKIYADAVAALMNNESIRPAVHAMAHITGGGLADNIERVIPEGMNCTIQLRRGSWRIPPVFSWLQKLGPVVDDEMAHVFNMGLGYTVIVAADSVDAAKTALKQAGSEATVIGQIVEGPRGVEWV